MMVPVPDADGQVLADRYVMGQRLGSGGTATVFLADDRVLDRPVAIKWLRPGPENADSAARRFQREARITASLNHQNTVQLYDAVVDGADLFLVMEYVPGPNLAQRIRDPDFTTTDAIAVLRDIGRALDHAHHRGVVHRDVKPANILLDNRSGRAKLADLGIASTVHSTRMTTAGSVLGTPAYIAPELFDGRSATAAADIYSLAAVAFEALSGHPLREGDAPIAVAYKAVTTPPKDLRDVQPDAPPAAADVLARALARDPAQRPASCRALVQALTAAYPAQVVRQPGAATRPVATFHAPPGPGAAVPDLEEAPGAGAAPDVEAASHPGAAPDVEAASHPGPAPDLEAASHPGAARDLEAASGPGAPDQEPAPGSAPSSHDAASDVEAAPDLGAAPEAEAALDAEAAPRTEAALDAEAAPRTEAAPDAGAAPDREPAAVHDADARPDADALPGTVSRPGTEVDGLPIAVGRVAEGGVPTQSWRPRRASGRLIAVLGACGAAVLAAVLLVTLSPGASHQTPPRTAGTPHRAASPKTAGTPGTGARSPAASPTAPASGGPVQAGTGPATSPAAAVEQFYLRAARHDYPNAWALAAPSYQQQLQGYDSFRATFANVRSIHFQNIKTVSQTGSTATVAVSTVSYQTTQTQYCSGTVSTQAAAANSWQISQISIQCQ